MAKSSSQNQPATAAKVRKIVLEATDAILDGVGQMFDQQNSQIGKVEKRLDSVEAKLGKVKSEISWLRDDVKGLEAEFSNTPSRKEFSKLKARINTYHPIN